ncbi:MAG TPA: hypothetical protein VFS89_06120, partial [Nitrosospira sp.]|nr:hypothetical protein [Nitrosospira sp.]
MIQQTCSGVSLPERCPLASAALSASPTSADSAARCTRTATTASTSPDWSRARALVAYISGKRCQAVVTSMGLMA